MAKSRHHPDPAKQAKARGALFKLFGSIVLLVAFVIQNNFYDRSSARLNELRTATLERAVVDKGAQLAEVLYFEAAATDDALIKNVSVSEQQIHRAAVKIAESTSMTVFYNDALDGDQKIELRRQLELAASQVFDFASYLQFLDIVHERFAKYAQDIANQTQVAVERRKRARGAFLFVYAGGAVLLLVGLAFEWYAAHAEMVASRRARGGA